MLARSGGSRLAGLGVGRSGDKTAWCIVGGPRRPPSRRRCGFHGGRGRHDVAPRTSQTQARRNRERESTGLGLFLLRRAEQPVGWGPIPGLLPRALAGPSSYTRSQTVSQQPVRPPLGARKGTHAPQGENPRTGTRSPAASSRGSRARACDGSSWPTRDNLENSVPFHLIDEHGRLTGPGRGLEWPHGR